MRSTKGDSRLNHVMMLLVHEDRTDALTLVNVANDFVGEKEIESNCLANFPRTISQTSSLFRQSHHKRKIRDKTRGIIHHNCSDLTCTKKYALTEGPKWGGGGINDVYSLSPTPVIFCILNQVILLEKCSSNSRPIQRQRDNQIDTLKESRIYQTEGR